MKKILLIILALLSMALSMSAADDGIFEYYYPAIEDIPYNLGYQDYDKSDKIFKLKYLDKPVKLAYHITSEEDMTVEVVFDPSYMELVDIVIPDKAIDPNTGKEYTVTAIGKMAFDDCPEIRSVIMGDSITRIEDYAFNMCENKVLHKIGYVKFSKNLTHIGNYAFKNCHNLTTGYYREGDQFKLEVNNKVVNTDYPFYGYGGRLTGLDNYLLLPESVNYIGKHAFEGCYFEEGDSDHKNYGLCKVKIPNPSCVIDDYAFAGCKFLELITIGEELKYDGLKNPTPTTDKKGRIGDYAFADCNLMRLDIPSSIESIGENAFSNCFHRSKDHTPRTNDGRVYFDDLNWFFPRSLFHNESDSWHNWNFFRDDNDGAVKQYIKVYDNYLERWHTNTVTIHSDRTQIGLNAFANNPLLESVKIKDKAGEIEAGTFRNCPMLRTVELPDDLTELSSSMFMNCTALDTIIIPDKVMEIGDSAFYKCEKLKTLELPSYLTKVNPYTFYGCKELSLSTLPGEVSSIGNHAFFGCKEITSFTIPNKVTTIGDYAFADCYLHEFSRISDVSSWHYGLTNIKFGDGVQTIGAHAFDGCRHLGTIEMGENLREIGDYAFQNCMSCPVDNCEVANNELTLLDSLIKMGTGAFQGCTNLPRITLGNDMTELPDFAFAYCSKLSYVGNIANITSAKENTFLGCSNLTDFGNLYADVKNLIDGIIYNDEGTEVISALPNITNANIKDGVTKICDGAFANCGALENVVFPTTLQEIGSRAFENCTSLQKADLINVNMGELVYAGCTGIESVVIAEDFTQDLQDNWFAGCINMSAIAVDGDNKRYSSYENQLLLNKEEDTLLRAPSGIDYLEIPESVIKIGDYACSNCIYLYSVEIPSTVTHIGAHAFDGCYMEEVDNTGNIKNSWGLETVYFYNPAVTIDEYAFNNCKFLVEINWIGEAEPGVMGSIGTYAFNNCENLTFSTDNLRYAAIDSLKPYAFANFLGIKDIELPGTLQSIGDHAFDNCQNLTSVVFPESLKSIGNSAFKSSGLTYLDLPDNIVEIGDSAFMDCSKVMELTLPSGLKKIKPYTFYKCFSGRQFDKQPEENFNLSIEIPESVESIGDYAFYGCAVNSKKYKNVSSTNTFSTNLYYYYKYGLSSVSIGDGVETIGAHAFDGCHHLLEVKMGNKVSSIGDYAFNNCFTESFLGVREVRCDLTGQFDDPNGFDAFPIEWELASNDPSPITLPENLKSLGEGAFNDCMKLSSINFPGSLTEIPAQAFNGCANLLEIKLPEGIRSVGNGAFGGCKRVKEISVPASLEEGSRVFVDCDNALNVTYLAEVPKTFDEAFFSPKVYASKEAELNTPNALIENVKGISPWAHFYKIVAKNDTLFHLERVLEEKNGLRFRVLSNKPTPYCEVAGPAFKFSQISGEDTVSAEDSDGSQDEEAAGSSEAPIERASYVVPEYVYNIDEESPYFGQAYKVIRIGNDAFENDLTLVGITIPESVIEIGQEAFNGCKNLPEITLPASITNMGERAFANCYGLTYFEVPPLVTRLNPEVLKDCRGLQTVRMHDNIEELCMGALMDCRHLRSFERSENWKLRLIDDYALKNCIELEQINIPEGVEKIGKEAMYYCQKLVNVSLPTTVKVLGENIFDDCERLTIIRVYTEEIPEIRGEANLTDQNCKIYVQAKTLEDYREIWDVHAHRIEPGIQVYQPSREEMPEYDSGVTYKISAVRPLDGQVMTWSSSNSVVAAPDNAHDGTLHLKAVGPTHIKVETDLHFYHEYDLDVYPQLADANWDACFDISDAVNIANYAVQNQKVLTNWWETGRGDFDDQATWEKFYYVGADVNKDGAISFADASATVKVVLAQPVNMATDRKLVARADGGDIGDALVVFPTERNVVHVGLDNSIEYVGLQANIRVPEGCTLKEVKGGARAAGHVLSSRRIDDRTMRIVLFDLDNKAFADNGGPLLDLVVDGDDVIAGDIDIFDIIASDISATSFKLKSRAGLGMSGVESVETGEGISFVLTADGLTLYDVKGKNIAICTIDGRVIRTFTAAYNSETINLTPGMYVVSVNGMSTKIAIK